MSDSDTLEVTQFWSCINLKESNTLGKPVHTCVSCYWLGRLPHYVKAILYSYLILKKMNERITDS